MFFSQMGHLTPISYLPTLPPTWMYYLPSHTPTSIHLLCTYIPTHLPTYILLTHPLVYLFTYLSTHLLTYSCTTYLTTYPPTLDAPPNSLIDSNANPKVKITEEEKEVGVCSFTHSILGVHGSIRAPGWGLGQMTSKSIIHIDLHKPNNKLVSA